MAMIAGNRATPRDENPPTDRGDQPIIRGSAGAMALQSNRGFEAAPQTFVRLTGSRLAAPRDRHRVNATASQE
ncbi:hypothetical protein DCG74_22400 [Bradyrhizobium sp. WBAH42]|nr:hypothetical protein [Bradyrhizobium sp. WBAH30]MDD1547413.1 hypothetical protein [Bradyrhizobium sp. WBAH41]MDD1561051.1 hypothetical protein [Bradyrhizobium sp. WBAH23]MDD1568493.1 hypothetical protein [Bradyrhizobium sp. WBAH33]MDD1594422.1 hypothetical protein [Bradyrhizobium sp. WBAH42]NRB90975.1 hypothetical protein [Bradyrhizobium sp. WBAH10]QCJ91034.1 hypothetical protein DAA57_22855 [Bradyrhizobium yuanmingense]